MSDSRVSRGAAAVRLIPDGQVSVRIEVPPGALALPAVLPDAGLESLQGDVPPSTLRWRVSPGAMSEPWTVAGAGDSALALLRAAVWDESTELMHLLRTRGPVVVVAGRQATFALPVVITIAGCAVEVATPLTGAPPVAAPRCVGSFDVAPLRRALMDPTLLERVPPPAIAGGLRIPGAAHALSWEAAERAVAQAAPDDRDWFVFPALRDGGEPLVLLAFRDRRSGWRLLGTTRDPSAWIAEIAAAAEPAAGPAPRGSAPDRPSPPPAARPAPTALASPERFGDFTTYDAATAHVIEQLRAAAPSALSVLLLGESGTGKELLAAQIHRESGRAGAFLPVSCAAIPDNLMESELFGHVGGAYTGARGDRPGAFVAARGGTLFLDEIGDAPMSVQLGLLRALETRRVKPVGADREIPVDVRVVAATSRDLDELVRAERFRFDLYHRIAQLVVRVPPLRERPADVEWLAEDLLRAVAPARRLGDDAKAALAAHPWPGNVRELRNAIERAVALGGDTGAIHARDLVPRASTPPRAPSRLAFPEPVRDLARRALAADSMPKPENESANRARARQRAAFLYLRLEEPQHAWARGLTRQFQRIFGPLWATSEGGRGLSELMIAAGLNPAEARDRDEIATALAQAGIHVGGG